MKNLLLICAIFLLGNSTLNAQTTLNPGDIAFVGYNTYGPEADFSVILLTNIDAGTEIKFTDEGWDDILGFQLSAGDSQPFTWTSTSSLPCGTIIQFITYSGLSSPTSSTGTCVGTPMDLGNIGDQIFAFQGTFDINASFIAGIHWNVTGSSTDADWDGSAFNSQTSQLPNSLTEGVSALWLHNGPYETQNAIYACSVTDGTPAFVAGAINLSSLWTQGGISLSFVQSPFPCAFSIICPPLCDVPDVPTITASSSSVCPGTTVTLDWTGANLNDATTWNIYETSCGVNVIGAIAGAIFDVAPTVTTTYYIRGEDGTGCIDESIGVCGEITVTVEDLIDPTITCPSMIIACEGDIVTFTEPTGADNCSATVAQTDVTGLTSGMVFPVGTTILEYTATDGSGNTATCSFEVQVTSIDVSVTNSEPTLMAILTGVTYQWLDCDNGYAIIPSETNQAFTATTNGSYAVEITLGSCVDTSACEDVTTIGVVELLEANQVEIFPNPTKGSFTISLAENIDNSLMKVYDVLGNVVIREKLISSKILVDLSEHNKGVYFVEIQTDKGNSRKKVILQ